MNKRKQKIFKTTWKFDFIKNKRIVVIQLKQFNFKEIVLFYKIFFKIITYNTMKFNKQFKKSLNFKQTFTGFIFVAKTSLFW